MKTNFANLKDIYTNYRDHRELAINRVDTYREKLNGTCNIDEKFSYLYAITFPAVTLGKTYYTNYNGAVCQVRFTSFTYDPNKRGSHCELRGVVAYNGQVFPFTYDPKQHPYNTDIFATTDDYKANKYVDHFSVSLLWLFDFLTDRTYNINEYYQVGSASFYYIWRYMWDGARANVTRTDLWTKCTERVTIYADRVSVGKDDEDLNECLAHTLQTTYKMKAECEGANSLQVCTFDECEPTERVVVKTTKVTIEITEEQRIVLAQMGINL